ncbi:hypothetical protein BDY19DRAFT_476883 [Irpex rosettiformis]|uniref:Uncharacterized protein n=1 Tax=Irpex rosettiformis TaxID=378272 RepID=A0ACB8TS34_9APHY|nr:hypothetical protein BDY19DRAFT_476883 [Irpex rosettiformis]
MFCTHTFILKKASQVETPSSHPSSAFSTSSVSPRPPLIATVRQVENAEGRVSTHLELPTEPSRALPQLQTKLSSSAMPPPSFIPTIGATSSTCKSSKNKRSSEPLTKETTKKAKINSSVSALVLPALPVAPLTPVEENLQIRRSDMTPSSLRITDVSRAVPNTVVHSTLSGAIPSRFKPLIMKKKPSQIAPFPSSTKAVSLSRTAGSSVDSSVTLRYLELAASPAPPSLSSITLPPSLQHRKRVQQWAIILSQIDEESCAQCSLVSKMLRYAGILNFQRYQDFLLIGIYSLSVSTGSITA